MNSVPFKRLFEIIIGAFFKLYENISKILPYLTTPIKDWFGEIIDTSSPSMAVIEKAFNFLFSFAPLAQFSILDLVIGGGLAFVLVYSLVIWVLNLIT